MKVDKNVAQQEVEAWLEHKNISKRKREENSETIEMLINAVEDGVLSINPDNFEITQRLHIPIENGDGEVTVSELVYTPRVKVFEIHKGLKGVKGNDIHGMVLAYSSVLTKKHKEVIRNLDTTDYSIAQGISVFFM